MPLKVDLPEHVIRTADRLARRMGCRFVPNKEPTLMSDLPELKYLDEAARAAGCGSWMHIIQMCAELSSLGRSIVEHAKSLQKLAELEAENARHHQADDATVERCAAIVEAYADKYLPGGPVDMKRLFHHLAGEIRVIAAMREDG